MVLYGTAGMCTSVRATGFSPISQIFIIWVTYSLSRATENNMLCIYVWGYQPLISSISRIFYIWLTCRLSRSPGNNVLCVCVCLRVIGFYISPQLFSFWHAVDFCYVPIPYTPMTTMWGPQLSSIQYPESLTDQYCCFGMCIVSYLSPVPYVNDDQCETYVYRNLQL